MGSAIGGDGTAGAQSGAVWRGAFAGVADVDVDVDVVVESPLSRTFWHGTCVIIFYTMQ